MDGQGTACFCRLQQASPQWIDLLGNLEEVMSMLLEDGEPALKGDVVDSSE